MRNKFLYVSSNVGIGTIRPIQKFQIGSVESSGEGNVFVVTSDSEVGIGTTTPISKLDVRGDTYISGVVTASQFSTGVSGIGVNITSNTISGPAIITIDPAAVGDDTGAVRIKGDLYIDGTQFIVNSTTIELADFNVGIATTIGTNLLLDGAGIGIGSTSIRKTLIWNNNSTALKSSEDFDVASGKVYKIAGSEVLSNNTLGSGILTSSLTSLGTIANLVSTNGTITNLTGTAGTITTFNSTNGTITNLTGTAGTITTFNSTDGTITTFNSTNGTITNLTGTAGTITTFNSTDGTITNLTGTNGTITNLTGTAGTITTFNSTNGTITNLTGTAGTITTLNSTNGTITNLTGTAGTITTFNSTNGTITNLTGTNGTITNLTGTAGTITTFNSTNGTITNLTGTAGTITTFDSTNGTITNLTGTAGTITTFNSTNGTITNLSSTNINASGIVTATSGFVGSLTGLASSATQLATGRTVAITGDLTYTSGSFDGTGNVTGTGTLATVNGNIGTFGSQTLIPVVTVNAKGLVTAVTTAAVGTALTVSGDSGSVNIDLLSETLTISGGTNLTSSAASNAIAVNLDPNISLTSVVASGVITAISGFSGNLTGNINSSGVSTVTSLIASNINASGIVTATQLSTGASGTGINITTNTISGPAILTIDPAAVGDNTGAVRIKGDLYVDGTQFIVNSTTIELADFIVGIASTATTDELADGAGIKIGSDNTLTYDHTNTALKSSENFNIVSGKTYKIAGTDVLSSTTLGSGVVNSSLTSLGTITNLVATNGTITNLTGTAGTITTFNSTNGTITNLTGTAGTITTFNSTNGTITNLTGTSGTITTLNSTNGTITNLTGTSGTITTFNSTDGTITNLTGTAGTITNLNSTNGTITNLSSTNINASGIVTATSGFVGSLTGLASSATQLATGRTVAITGDLTYTSGSFDGTGNVTGTGTLATVNSNVGQFGSQTLIPVVTVNAKGLVTAVTTAAVGTALTVSGDSGSVNIDLLSETLTISGGTNLTSVGSGNTVTVNLDDNISLTSIVVGSGVTINASGINASAGIITATTFVGALTGTASNVTTNANLTGDITSIGNATAIAAGVIVDADINSSAGIVDTKLATIATALKVSNSATTATSANTNNAIVARDASGNFSAGTITASLTGTASSTTNIPNLTGAIISNNTTTSLGSFTSSQLSTALTDETGSGSAVFATSPTLVTPVLGAASATSINSSGIVTATQFVTGASGSAIGINTNTISGPATITIDPAAVGDNTGLVVIKGDLQIDGTTTTINSTTVTVDDKNIVLGSGAINDAAADGSGITIESGNGNKTFQFEDTGDNLGSSENLNVASGKVYKVNNTSVLSSTTLGSGVVNSSLTSVGTLGQLQVTGVSTFTNGPILVGTATSTGTASQPLQVTGGAYVSGSFGIGTTNPTSKLQLAGSLSAYNSTSTEGAMAEAFSEIVSQPINLAGGASLDVGTIPVTNDNNWRAIVRGTFSNNYEGGGLTPPSFNLELNSTQNTIPCGGTSITVSRNTSTNRLKFTNNNATFRVTFTGTIEIIVNNQSGQPVNSITTIGKVGIGTANPQYKLDVIGDTRVTGSITSGSLNVSGSTTLSGTATINRVSISTVGVNTTLQTGIVYVYLTGVTELTLPSSPSVGDTLKIINRSGITTAVVIRNGSNIMSFDEDIELDELDGSFNFVYANSSEGWIVSR